MIFQMITVQHQFLQRSVVLIQYTYQHVVEIPGYVLTGVIEMKLQLVSRVQITKL